MNHRLLVTYKSVTGFTRQYAELIAKELDCMVVDCKEVSAGTMSQYDTVIFGGRFHAGLIDGLKRTKKLFKKSKAATLIVFATGTTPNTEKDMIAAAWKNNFTPQELECIPHFYMQSGLRYDKMPLGDKIMMKVFAFMVKHKKDKSEYERAMEKALAGSYDSLSREFIVPLISCVKEIP